MKIIVAGFSKTGTKTLNAALKVLGYNVYDYVEHLSYLEREWAKILNEGWTTEDFRQMYEHIDAVTDEPGFYFWEEIHKAFPEAKIILMQREEAAWYKSMEKQLRMNESVPAFYLMTLLSPTFRKAFKEVICPLGEIVHGMKRQPVWNPFGRIQINEGMQKMKYRAHNAHVLQNAPPDKLLLFECSQGWDPLCQFLEVPVPAQPFPHKNKGGELARELLQTPFVQVSIREVKISLTVLTVATVLGVYTLHSYGLRGVSSSIANAVNRFASSVGLR